MKQSDRNNKHLQNIKLNTQQIDKLLNTKYGIPVLIIFTAVIISIAFFNADNTSSEVRFLKDEIVSGVKYEVEVAGFVDGDTTEFYINGTPERFRYIIIDAPELDHNNGNHEPYALAAHERVQELLNDADIITVEFDSGEVQDNYDRFLAYVYADDVMLNLQLLEEGLVTMQYINTDNRAYFDEMLEAENYARDQQLGLWSE